MFGNRGLESLRGAMFATVATGVMSMGMAVAALAEGEGGPSGTLRVAASSQLTTFNPALLPNSTYTGFVYEGLFERSADGKVFNPRLAVEAKQTGLDLVIKLREGVLFHDGTPFNADAVIANIEFVKNNPGRWQYLYADVKEAVAVDDHTVKIVLAQSLPMLERLASRGAVMVSPKALADGSFEKLGTGTGPWVYSPDESVAGSKTVYNYFEDYYAPEDVGVKRYEMMSIRDYDVAYNSLRAGQIDVLTSIAAFTSRARNDGFGVDANPMGVYV